MSSQPLRFVQVALFIFGLRVFALGFQGTANPLDEVSGLLLTDQYEEAQALLSGLPESAQGVALKGEIEFRKGNFEAARAQYLRSLELDPETSRAHYGLGKLAMAKMESKEAVRSVMKAVELAPEEAIYRLTAAEAWGIDRNLEEQTRQFEAYVALEPSYDPDRVAEVQAALDVIQNFGSEKMGTYEIPDDQEPIPILKAINLIFADFMVGEKGPFEFIIDTGASQTVFTEKLVNELGLEPIASTLIHGIGGDGKVDTNIYRIDELKFGDIEIRNLPIGSIDEPMISELAAGIFSTATFSDQVVSIDYRRDRIEFNAPEISDNVEHIPSWFFNNLVLIPLTINGEHQGNFLVDTGAVTTVLSHRMAATLGVTEDTPGAKIDLGLAGIGGFEGVVLLVPEVVFTTEKNLEGFSQVVSIDMREISKMLGTEVAGIVGYDFLKGYRVSIDFQNAEVRLSK